MKPLPRDHGPAPAQDRFVLKKKNPWTRVFSLGSFIAGVTTGYWFCRLEREFISYGESLMIKVLKIMKQEPAKLHEHSRTTKFSHVNDDDNPDPLSEGSDYGLEDEV